MQLPPFFWLSPVHRAVGLTAVGLTAVGLTTQRRTIRCILAHLFVISIAYCALPLFPVYWC